MNLNLFIMKTLTSICMMLLCATFTVSSQNKSSTWDSFDPATHDAATPPPGVFDNQLNGQVNGNCHGYAIYQALGSSSPYPSGSFVINACDIDYSHAYVTSKSNATHVIWVKKSSYDPLPKAIPKCDIEHSALPSQFDALPFSDDYVQSANNPWGPGIAIHKISDYTNYESSLISAFVIFANAPSPIPLNYTPITPSSIFSCGAYIEEPISTCINGGDGSAIAVNSSSGPGTSRSYSWSNGSHTNTASNLSEGTYTVTVTESPTNYVCTSSVTINNPSSFSHFTYTPHPSGENCIGWQGGGSATIHLNSGLNPNNFSYQWDANAASQTSITASNLCYLLYDVEITSNNTGCSEIQTAEVPISFGPGWRKKVEKEEISREEISIEIRSKRIEINGLNGNATALLLSMDGKALKKVSLSENLTRINLSESVNGLYILTLLDAKGEKILSKKVSIF